jgi:hypothetical protein
MNWLSFRCKLDNDFIVLADQDRLLKVVTRYVKDYFDKAGAGPLIVESFFNRQLGRGVVSYSINNDCDINIEPMNFTVGMNSVLIIFHDC